MSEMVDERTAPREKKMERRVRRYCLECGRFSRKSVPSVGMEPLRRIISLTFTRWKCTCDCSWGTCRVLTHPTALPSKNIQNRSIGKVGAKLAPIPNTAVRKSVLLNGRARPRRSETVPQPTAPIIICGANQLMVP